MALKRPRGTDCATSSEWLTLFGKDEIHDITNQGNTTLTRGAFGEISMSIRQPSSDRPCEFVAVKTIEQAVILPKPAFGQPSGEPKLNPSVFNELCALQHLNPHPNIVPLVAVFPSRQPLLSKTALCLTFPYMPVDLHITLEWRRRSCLPLLSFDVVKSIARDLLSALAHCHRLGVLHRDIKPGNLLVSSTGEIQLCDFGLAKPFLDESHSIVQPKPGETGTKGLCTLYYRPPEVLLGAPAALPAVDMYSAGTVLVELVSGHALFSGRNVMEQLALVFDHLGTPTDTSWPTAVDLPDYGKLDFEPKVAQSWSEQVPRVAECLHLPELLSQLVVLDPAKRMSAEEALASKWFSPSCQPQCANRELMRFALIPPRLMAPPLLEPQDRNVASYLAVTLAAKRRAFLGSHLVSWTGASLPQDGLLDHLRSMQL